MVADSKQVATMVNIVGQQMVIIRASMTRIEAVKAAFATANPDVTGTPLEGKVAIVNSAITGLKAEVDGAVWTQMIAGIVPTHRNAALEV